MIKYQLGPMIGEGGFGQVFEATRLSDGLRCVVKQLSPGSSEDDIRRFQREVRLMQNLCHKNVVPILESGISNNLPWYAMPRALMSLEDYIKSQYGEDEVWIFAEILKGIDHAHSQGVIHRDIKPSNVLIYSDSDSNSYCRVSDFGLGRFMNRDTVTLTQTNMSMGTDLYMAPEQRIDAQRVDERADVYSLGIVLYELLTSTVSQTPLDFNTTSLPRKFVPLVQKATEGNPDDRYQTVRELIEDFNEMNIDEDEFNKTSSDIIETVISEMEFSQQYDSKSISTLANALYEYSDDSVMLRRILPKVRGPILEKLIVLQFGMFKLILQEYDALIADESLIFEYCDVVADFYKEIYDLTDDYEIRKMIITRLAWVGIDYNRWYVGEVFAGLVSRLDDAALIIVVKQMLEERPSLIPWLNTFVDKGQCPLAIRKLLRNINSN